MEAKAAGLRARWWRAWLDLGPPEQSFASVVYGELITGATIATAIGEIHELGELVEVTLSTLAVYWVAHSYADLVGARGAQRVGGSVWRQVRLELLAELPMIAACLPPVLTLLVATAFGASLDDAGSIALVVVLLLLVVFAYWSAAHAHLHWLWRIGVAILHGLLGGAIILLKVLLH